MVSTTTSSNEKYAKEQLDFKDWLALLEKSYPANQIGVLRDACELAQQAHEGQRRASGEPYFQHSLAVANILYELNLDYETMVAALLHDVVEDTEVSLNDISARFGTHVAALVDGVTKMDVIKNVTHETGGKSRDAVKAETLRKMLLAMVEDVRVVLVKLADRLHNMRTLSVLPEERQQRIAKETLDIFAPLANRLGIWQIKWELEDLSFRYIEPTIYKKIARLLNERRVDREQYIQRFIKKLDKALKSTNIEAIISGRPKHIYSIYRKMARKAVDYSQIYDVRAARVLVKDDKDCYAVLGVVHSVWQYIPGEFDDYIATPKANNYRSLHTAVIGSEGKTVEIQIRTNDMHQHSEYGVAAHWRYKEGVGSGTGFEKKISWLRQLLEWKDEVRDASDFVDKIKADIFEDRLYVFTPKGHVIDLPSGSTPLDFAYHIHTEVGHRCRGAKVNGRIVPLTYQLHTGEQVEVLKVRQSRPSRDWLNPHLGYLKSSRAKSKVQNWFNLQNVEYNLNAGRASLERELQKLGYRDINIDKLSREMKFNSSDELYASLGRNDLRLSQVINTLERMFKRPEPHDNLIPVAPRKRVSVQSHDEVKILGVGNLLTNFSQCCKPVPGDEIKGYITRGRGVSVHRSDCRNLLRFSMETPERIIEAYWGNGSEKTYPVDIQILAYDRQGLLRDVSGVLASEGINVVAVSTISNPKSHLAKMTLTLEIGNIEMLSRVLAKIHQLPNVVDARRETH